jgi:predicted nucleotidyltransferase
MAPDRSLIDRIALMHDLEDLLGGSVDVVNERPLHRAIRDDVLSQAVDP